MTSKVSRRVHHLVGFPDELGGGHDEFVDPNEDYVASLTEGERQAFNEALRGESVDGAAPDTGSLTAESGGCEGEGFAAIETSGLFGFYEEFGAALDAPELRVDADPQVAAPSESIAV